MTSEGPFVVVGGNIATGKSILVKALGSALGLDYHLECWQLNPWFGGAQNQMLASQLWFLVSAAADQARIASGSGGIQERCIHEHALVFGRESLNGGDAQLLGETYSRLDQLLPDPRLFVFLHASPRELERRVRKRARRQEADIDLARLTRLGERYSALMEAWDRCPTVSIDSEQWDLRVDEDLASVTSMIKERL